MKFITTLFNTKKASFYLFKFHTYFDGILGYETLSELEAIIDISNAKIILPKETIKMEIRRLGPSNITLNSNSVTKIKFPVSQNSGDVFLPKDIKINNAVIPSGLYYAENGFADTLVRNFGDSVTFKWTKPAKTLQIDDISEINNMNIKSANQSSSIPISDLEKLIRLQRLNQEERSALLKTLSKNPKIFHKESEKLSCTTAIQHRIKTVDDIPVHTKTYRYPHVHKAEVEKQINEMLADGIIQNSISPWTSPIWIVPQKLDASGKKNGALS